MIKSREDLIKEAAACLYAELLEFNHVDQFKKDYLSHPKWHFEEGIMLRNWLRDRKYGEIEFGCNLDDVYLEIVDLAIGSNKGANYINEEK